MNNNSRVSLSLVPSEMHASIEGLAHIACLRLRELSGNNMYCRWQIGTTVSFHDASRAHKGVVISIDINEHDSIESIAQAAFVAHIQNQIAGGE